MIDIYTECQPHGPHQPVEPIEHLKMVGAQYYTSLLSKLTSHINNTDVHVTNEDKVKWEKAFLDIKDLKDKVDDIDTDSKGSTIDLDGYATKTWVESQGYAYKNQTPTYQDLQQYATILYVDNAIKNIVIPEGDWVTEDELNRATANFATLNDVKIIRDDLDRDIHHLDEYCENTYLKKSEAGQQYELPVASTTTLGGFKVGSAPSGTNNYAVKMNGEYAYVTIPFSTTGGDEIEVTESYNIEVVSCTVQVSPRYEGSSDTVVSGYISWKVSKTIGSSYSYVSTEDLTVSSYASLMPSNQALSLSKDSSTNTFIGSTTPHMGNTADYVAITVEKGGVIVARQIVAVKEPGKKGDSAQQYIPDAMIRLRGEYNSYEEYSNGDIQDDYGCRWMDVVSYNGVYYRALKNGQLGAPVINGNENVAEWSRFAMFGDAAFNAVIANYLNARSITAEQIVILEDYDSTNPIPVAGIVGKNKYEYNGQEYDLIRKENGNDDNPIVIFAGSNSGNITNSPFRVYKDGSLVANNANIQGSVTVVGEDGQSTCELAANTTLGVEPHLNLRDASAGYKTHVSAQGINLSNKQGGPASDYVNITPTGIVTNGTVYTTDLVVNGNITVKGQSIGDTWIYFDGNNGNLLLHFVGGILTETFFGGGETFNIIPRGEQYYIMNGIDDISFLTKS